MTCYVTLMRPSWLQLFSTRRSRRWSRLWYGTWHRRELAACPWRSSWGTGTELWSVPCQSWSWRRRELAACPWRSPAASWWETGTELWSVPCQSLNSLNTTVSFLHLHFSSINARVHWEIHDCCFNGLHDGLEQSFGQFRVSRWTLWTRQCLSCTCAFPL